MEGYIGRVLFINLTSGSIGEEMLPNEVYRHFIGGVGLGVRVLYERMAAKVVPLGISSMLGFITGPLTGTPVPGASSRYKVVGKSPLTGTWGDADAGGFFGAELKASGYDAVFFTGISPKPVYLLLCNGKAELKDGTYLWGKDTTETEEILRQELGDQAVRVACVGPSGESQSLLASVISDKGRAAARSGLGAVMGAKHLKAIAVRGTKKVPVADSGKLSALRSDYLKGFRKAKELGERRKFGTCYLLEPLIKRGATPIKNWMLSGPEAMPSYSKLCAANVINHQVKRFTCPGCPVSCGGIVKVKEGPYAVSEGHKPEYETLASFGTLCLNDDVKSVIKANDICNRYGVDTISTGSVIAFAMECYERGIIDKVETGGIELTWGNAPAIIAILERIVRRQGFGAVLADGVAKAAERIGKKSERYAVHIHGQELPAHDPRYSQDRATGYIVNPTPARHIWARQIPKRVPVQGPLCSQASNYYQVAAAAGCCAFILLDNAFPLIEFMSAVTGWDLTIDEVLTTGQRIQTLRQAFNIREGIHSRDFRLPKRLTDAWSMGPLAGIAIDQENLRASYYAAMDWDIETGQPSELILKKLALQSLKCQ